MICVVLDIIHGNKENFDSISENIDFVRKRQNARLSLKSFLVHT